MDNRNSDLSEEIELFLQKFALKYRVRSVMVKRESLIQFLQFVQGKISSWAACDQKLLRQYIIYRSQKVPEGALTPLSAASMQTHFAAIRVFLEALVERGILLHNPAKLIKPPKSNQKLPKVLSVELLQKLLSMAPENALEYRDLAICELFYSSGLRLSELAALTVFDIDFAAREVRVIAGKGGKGRILPLGGSALNALRLWQAIRCDWAKEGQQAFFISRQGRGLSTRQISQRVKAFGAKLGIGLNLHPHMLRHSMATHVLESSQDIRAVQELLGHADISTTQVYTHLDFGHLSKIFDAAHPRAKKKPPNAGKKKPRD